MTGCFNSSAPGSPKMPKRLGLPLTEWPTPDLASWQRATNPTAFFSEDGCASEWRPRTRDQALYAYGRWLGHLAKQNPSSLRRPAAERVSQKAVASYVRALQARSLRDMSIAAELNHLALALSAVAPQAEWKWLRALHYRWSKTAIPREKRPKLVDPNRLITLGLTLIERSRTIEDRLAKATAYRDGLMIALLASRPLRRANFAALEVGSTFLRVGLGYTIAVPGSSAKGGEDLEYSTPDFLASHLREYLDRIRDLFPGAQQHQALWPSAKGGGLTGDGMYQLISRRTKEAFGFEIHPHLFRDIAATAIARSAPESMSVARDLLGHARLDTTNRYYDQSKCLNASRRLGTIISELRVIRPLRVDFAQLGIGLPETKTMLRLNCLRDEIAAALGLDEPKEIDAALEDISTVLARSWLLFSQVDQGLSTAKQRQVLRRMTGAELSEREKLGALDHAVVARLGMYVAGGTARLMLHTDPLSAEEVEIARLRALESVPATRGRPQQTASLGLKQLALGLAVIWAETTGKAPTRTVKLIPTREPDLRGAQDDRYVEAGPFHEFVRVVLSVVPRRVRPAVDNVVRLAIAEREAAVRDTGRGTIPLGLIDEATWLGR